MLNRREFISIGLVASFFLAACGQSEKVTQPKLDTSELDKAIAQMVEDIDEYEMNEDMKAYTDYVSSVMSLSTDSGVTQEEIDASVAEIKRLRDIVTKQYELPEALTLNGVEYATFVSEIPENIGNAYHVRGNVTTTNHGLRGADYYAYVWWDESHTKNEVSCIRIPYDDYHESVIKYFEGDCELEGTDDAGHPQFLCRNGYTAK